MSNFLSRLFGSKKKITKAVSRRLELLGLEDRIVPATISVVNNQVVIQLVDNEDISDLNTFGKWFTDYHQHGRKPG